MDFKPVDKTIKDLLISGHQFEIPRFQRAYSWEKRHYAEFLRDIISNLKVENGQISADAYFVGTMLFVGNFLEAGKNVIKVVDGQQRLTTITILFSVLSDLFKGKGEDTLAKKIFNYIMTEDDNGKEVRVLNTKTSYPYFAYYIQDYAKTYRARTPITEEEENIKQTYEYFHQQLQERKIRQLIKKNNVTGSPDTLNYIDILKAIRDQVLNCSFVSIATETGDQASRIFEILNAKGKRLDVVDLIKNRIFDVLDTQEPVDVAEDYWMAAKKKVEGDGSGVGMATFYRHFWAANYSRETSGKLYDAFNTLIKPADKDRYADFLVEMLEYANYYSQIVTPNFKNYGNKQQYRWLYQSLTELTDTFNVVQVRVPLMALLHAKKKDKISMTHLKKAVTYLENFHFAFNVITSDRGNKLDAVYSSFATALKKASTKVEAYNIIEKLLIAKLENNFPSFNKFADSFVKLAYAKESQGANVKTRYALRKLSCAYSGSENFEQDMTVEHILPEYESESHRNIGNLILLEKKLNDEARILDYQAKKAIYVRSKSEWVASFVKENDDWNEGKFKDRAIKMARDYYEKVLGRRVDAT